MFQIGDYPPPDSASAPGNYPITIGVGASDYNDNVAYFSARGYLPDTFPWQGIIKPDLVAPGVDIKSAWPGGGYEYLSTTGAAAPQVTGGIALFFQKNPNLDFQTVHSVLIDYARQPPQGAPYPNIEYGYGILNLYQSLLHVPLKVEENDFGKSRNFKIFPVLSRGEIYIKYLRNNPVIFIFNTAGIKLDNFYILKKSNGYKINLNQLPKGIYFIYLNKRSRKIILF